MLKKQTVWLLTMLSLMIVLSAYYLLSDKEDLAYVQTEEDMTEETIQEENSDEDVEVEDIDEVTSNELFTMIRMELEDERNMKKDRLKEVVASNNATTSEINDALNEIEEIETIGTKESILQESILSASDNYEEVLVRAEDDKVHVHVITEDLPKEEANQIMQMVKDELGEVKVDVNFQGITD